ncbi:MAG: BamA/TamA family outer membrane protein [Bacteroidota bacterium]|nr:BamA/TamA family outer membrane protein [Bacteroidota bacterium]
MSLLYSQQFDIFNFIYSKSQKTTDTIVISSNSFEESKRKSDSIIKHYQNIGYIRLQHTSINQNKNNRYSRSIFLNQPIEGINVHIPKDYYSKYEFLKSTLSRKREIKIPFKYKDSLLKRITNSFSEQGFVFTETKLLFLKETQDTLFSRLTSSTSEKRRIDNIEVKGYKKFPKKIIKSQIIDKSFTPKLSTAINKKINSIPFIESTRNSELLFQENSTTLYLYLKKKNINTAEGLLGFNNNNGKLELNGYLDLYLENNFDAAERFQLTYRNDQEDQTRVHSAFTIPYVAQSNFGLGASLEIVRRDSTYQRNNFEIGTSYKIDWNNTITLNYESQNTTDSGTILSLNNLETDRSGLNIGYRLEKWSTDLLHRQNLIFQLKIGTGTRELPEDKENYLNIDATITKLWHLSNRSKILSSLKSQILKTDKIQFNELYQLGGNNSIRGFNQNSIDSSQYATLLLEYRYNLSPTLYINSITDAGIFQSFIDDKAEYLTGFGVGVGILTNSGILSLNIASGNFGDANFNLTNLIGHIEYKVLF